ncbi:Glycoside hydrolase, subgroup, catalytic core [Cordyceps fumosorosea ARSEF 2679]|uniref:chitinase n=1 Tax=Cordyceps fumosorosea (strain ARSEF 2679) TaxID=1081104 RepID=A0A167T1E3_CORFA|nr:Glycoside hydrolase, subgroup, catalytic core [Cordyceps fumosorosea ARSEF 2679]OAA60149.1 Glycoside hydrolase, subgroup, catalytic core [Cordyceps fumosorosea ARSEF 2679]
MVSKLLTALAVAGVASAAGTNVAKFNAYWGQSGPATERLKDRCDEGADYISLSFVTSSPENNPTGYPGIGFAAHCWATGFPVNGVQSQLLDHCGTIIEDLQYCRDKGIKMLLSIGGVWDEKRSDYRVTTEKNGRDFADFLWGAFGPWDPSWKGPRPFDTYVNGVITKHTAVDGFDFDLELPQVNGQNFDNKPWIAMADQFRSHSKGVIITGAPQCPTSPQWFAMKDMIQQTQFDALFIQFYNNVGCDLIIGNDPTNPNDDFNYDQWEDIIAASDNSKNAKLFVGVPGVATPKNPQDGYVTPSQLEHIICKIAKRDSFGGISVWDMWAGKENVIGGKSFNQHVQDILSKCGAHTTTTTTTTTTTSTTSSTTSTTTTTTSSSSSITTTTSSSSSTPTATSTSTSSSTSSQSTSSSSSSSSVSSSSSSSAVTTSSSSSVVSTSQSSSSSSTVPTGSSSSSSAVTTGSSSSAQPTGSSSSSSAVTTSSTSSAAPTSVSSSSSVVPTSQSSSSGSVPTSSGTAIPTSVSSSSIVLTTGPATTTGPVTTAPWSNTTTTSQEMTTSTVFTTTTRTITSCAPTVTNCPARVVTETIALYTTVCPVTKTNQPPKPTATPSQSTEELTTSTVYTTTTYTISKCPPSVTNCPIGHVTTETISLSTTVCPVTKTNEVPQPTQPAGKPPGGEQPSSQQPSSQQPSGSKPTGPLTTTTLHSTKTVIKTLSLVPETTLTVVPVKPTGSSKCPGGPNCPAPAPSGELTKCPGGPNCPPVGTGAPSAPIVKPTTPIVTGGASSVAAGLVALVAAQLFLL